MTDDSRLHWIVTACLVAGFLGYVTYAHPALAVPLTVAVAGLLAVLTLRQQ
ncbi:hypothetical protein [Streptomyces sp. NPDC060366]|uniref:hypothetical protein n=1 Tax=Streptomyces sp. NPDC060366 TaxID=3347105 RepID=UPI003657ABC5